MCSFTGASETGPMEILKGKRKREEKVDERVIRRGFFGCVVASLSERLTVCQTVSRPVTVEFEKSETRGLSRESIGARE